MRLTLYVLLTVYSSCLGAQGFGSEAMDSYKKDMLKEIIASSGHYRHLVFAVPFYGHRQRISLNFTSDTTFDYRIRYERNIFSYGKVALRKKKLHNIEWDGKPFYVHYPDPYKPYTDSAGYKVLHIYLQNVLPGSVMYSRVLLNDQKREIESYHVTYNGQRQLSKTVYGKNFKADTSFMINGTDTVLQGFNTYWFDTSLNDTRTDTIIKYLYVEYWALPLVKKIIMTNRTIRNRAGKTRYFVWTETNGDMTYTERMKVIHRKKIRRRSR